MARLEIPKRFIPSRTAAALAVALGAGTLAGCGGGTNMNPFGPVSKDSSEDLRYSQTTPASPGRLTEFNIPGTLPDSLKNMTDPSTGESVIVANPANGAWYNSMSNGQPGFQPPAPGTPLTTADGRRADAPVDTHGVAYCQALQDRLGEEPEASGVPLISGITVGLLVAGLAQPDALVSIGVGALTYGLTKLFTDARGEAIANATTQELKNGCTTAAVRAEYELAAGNYDSLEKIGIGYQYKDQVYEFVRVAKDGESSILAVHLSRNGLQLGPVQPTVNNLNEFNDAIRSGQEDRINRMLTLRQDLLDQNLDALERREEIYNQSRSGRGRVGSPGATGLRLEGSSAAGGASSAQGQKLKSYGTNPGSRYNFLIQVPADVGIGDGDGSGPAYLGARRDASGRIYLERTDSRGMQQGEPVHPAEINRALAHARDTNTDPRISSVMQGYLEDYQSNPQRWNDTSLRSSSAQERLSLVWGRGGNMPLETVSPEKQARLFAARRPRAPSAVPA